MDTVTLVGTDAEAFVTCSLAMLLLPLSLRIDRLRWPVALGEKLALPVIE